MHNSLVAEDKIKFPCQVGLLVSNNQLQAYTDVNNRGTLRIRHLFDHNVKDLVLTYEQPIHEIYLTSASYLIVLNSLKQVEVSYVKVSSSQITQTQICSFKKGSICQLYAKGSVVAALSASSVDIYQFKDFQKANKTKFEISSPPKHIQITNSSVYLYCMDSVLRQISLKQSKQVKEVLVKEGIAAISSIELNGKDHLILVNQGHTMDIVPIDLNNPQHIEFTGEFRKLIVVNNSIDVITNTDKQQQHNFYCVLPTTQGSFVVHSELYERNSLGCQWLMINIQKNQVVGYLKRKGTAGSFPQAISPETCSIIYILNTADRAKVDVFKVDHSTLADLQTPPTKKAVVRHSAIFSTGSSPVHMPLKQVSSTKVLATPQTLPQPAIKPNKKAQAPTLKQPLTQNARQQQMSKAFVQAFEQIVDKKLSPICARIQSIESKIKTLEQKMQNQMTEQKLQSLYTKTLQTEVVELFNSRVLPKMDEYFRGIFVELGKVFQQGITYYSQKLNAQSQIQRECFDKILKHTFKTTNQIMELGREQLTNSVKLQELLDKCRQKKEEIANMTTQLLQTARTGFGRIEDLFTKQPLRQPPREQRKSFVKTSLPLP